MATIFTSNGALNKNLVKLAKSFNLELYLDSEEKRITISEIDEDGEAMCEWLYSYNVAENGDLFFGGNIYFSEKEELPYMITSYDKVKELITFTANTLKA